MILFLIRLPELRLTAEQVGQVFKHVHIIQLAAFYDRVDDSPSPCAGMIAKEKIVVHTELAWTHGTLGCIIIRLKETVIELVYNVYVGFADHSGKCPHQCFSAMPVDCPSMQFLHKDFRICHTLGYKFHY